MMARPATDPAIRSGASGNPNRAFDLVVIGVAAGVVLGWILAVRGDATLDGRITSVLSANDRSRWATVYSLAERGTYNIDESLWPPSIDRVRLNGHYYSSKPPLLPTLVAGEYLLLRTVSLGTLSLTRNPEVVIRIVVLTLNWIPFVVYLIVLSRLLERQAANGWVRHYSLLAAALGTYLASYCVTLNNHTVAAFSVLFALYPALRIWCDGELGWKSFAISGFFSAFAAVNEFPALSFFVALSAALFWKARRQALRFFLPFALIPAAGHFATNYLVSGTLIPAYAQKEAYDFPGSYWKVHPDTGRLVSSRIDPATGRAVMHNNIDSQYEPWWFYSFHLLVGHHGVFSLSPVFLFSMLGLAAVLGNRSSPLRVFGAAAAAITLTVLVFYVFFADQRNYGGATSGFRWLFWLIPLWLLFLPAGLERVAGRSGWRVAAIACLAISAASVAYSSRNPWSRPWLHEWMSWMGWISY